MNSFVSIITLALLAIFSTAFASVLPAAPLVAAPAAIGYAKAVPYNVPPYASRVDISTRNLALPYVAAGAPYVAAPAFSYAAAPAAAPLVAGPGVVPATYARTVAAPFPYVAQPALW